jgi:citrate lyase subunit beta/citryl-CoA lyase
LRRRATLPQRIILRLNPVFSSAFQEDCAILDQCTVDGIMLSKCRTADDVCRLEEVLKTVATLDNCRVYPLLESPEALLNAFSIAMVSPRVAALAFGAEDFAAEMGIVRTADEIELLYARSSLVAQARAAGRDALDSPCLEFRAPRRLAASARRARNLGFTGKLAIHPSQVRTLNKIFSPAERELKAARDIVAAASANPGAFSIDGSMVDEAVLKRARRVLGIAPSSRR